MRSAFLALPFVALTLAVAVGCSGGGAPASPAPSAVVPATAPPPLGTAARVGLLPLEQYMLRPAAANDLDTVVNRLTRECLQRRGVRWQPGERNAFDLLRDRTHRFGLTDEDLAASAGYHWDPVPAARSRPDPAGCSAEAYQDLGWVQSEFLWLEQVNDTLLRQTYADPRATAITGRWSRCMGEAGFRYAQPRDAAADARWWASTPAPPTAAEKQTAVADVRCKARVGFSGELTDVLAGLQAAAVARDQDRLEEFRRMAARAVTRADVRRGDHRSPEPAASGAPVAPGGWRTQHAPA